MIRGRITSATYTARLHARSATYRGEEGVQRRPPLVVSDRDRVQLVFEPDGRGSPKRLLDL